MSTNVAAQALRDQPGYVPRPSSTASYTPSFPAVPTVPALPPLDPRAPNTAGRDWLLQQLGPASVQNNANLTNIQAGAKLQLAGYGGWRFGTDNPATPEREDLLLSFDSSTGPGQREKQAFRQEDNQSNARGLFYSSFHNQNLAAAAQRLSLEGQQIANQYAFNLNQQHTAYANQVTSIATQWTSLYGADTAWLAENPPPPPPPPAPPPGPGDSTGVAPPGARPGGYGVQRMWTGANPPNKASLSRQWGVPAASIHVTRRADGGYEAFVYNP